MIDLHGLLRIITSYDPDTKAKNEEVTKREALCGGRFKKYQDTCELLFKNLSKCGDLVFFVDGSLVTEKLCHWIAGNEEKYHLSLEVIEMIDQGKSVSDICRATKELPRFTTHLSIVERIAKKYGNVMRSMTRECDSEIAKFAIENNAFVVLAEDSDFLIFKGDWKYFSLNELNIDTLKTKEYNRYALWNFLGLKNFFQMAMLATLSGNDLVNFDDVKRFHFQLTEGKFSIDRKFLALADFVKYELVERRTRDNVKIMLECAIYRGNWNRVRPNLLKSIEMYHTVS